ncbi:MAG: esterase, partial [Actinobacteria bacterium]|nr:esterase [Actinomycetota bacterium]
MGRPIPRRTFLAGGVAGVLGAGGLLGAGAVWVGGRRAVDDGPGPIPDAPPGDERVERRHSEVRGRDVDFYTAVPADHGDGRGLPVCLILHGASATAADYPRFGFGRFLTDAVRRGAAPFVLAGATGSPRGWEPVGGDDPMRMVFEELPRWCADRGFDTARQSAWGWSLGGYGVLRLAEVHAGFVRAVA